MGKKLVYPDTISVEPPNQDLPEDIKQLYKEAADILNKSPRAAAAILRLALEKFCQAHGDKKLRLSENIELLRRNNKIGEDVYKAMESIRAVGNDAVHAGAIDFNDENSLDVAKKLFKITNIIANRLITDKKEINEFYTTTVPESKRKEGANAPSV